MRVRVVAEQQFFSDSEGRAWMTQALQAGKENGDLLAFGVTEVYAGGIFELQLIQFWVELDTITVDYNAMRDEATDLLNEIIGDSDVNVRFLCSPQEVTA